MKYMNPTITAMSANEPHAMIITCVLVEIPRLPSRSTRSGCPVAPARNAVPQFGHAASSKGTIWSQRVQGQPVGFVSSAGALASVSTEPASTEPALLAASTTDSGAVSGSKGSLGDPLERARAPA